MNNANMRICVFSGLGTSQGPGSNTKAVFDKLLYNYCSKKIPEHFVPKNGIPKTDFQILFSKSDLGGGCTYFVTKKF